MYYIALQNHSVITTHLLQCRLSQKCEQIFFMAFEVAIKINNTKDGRKHSVLYFFLLYLCNLHNMHEEEKQKGGKHLYKLATLLL